MGGLTSRKCWFPGQRGHCWAKFLRSRRGTVHHFQHGSFGLLEVGDDLEEAFRLGISGCAEHSHEDLGGAAQVFAEFHKADRAVDVLAEHGLSGVHIAGDHAADGFAEQGAAEAGALLEAAFDRVVEILGEGHSSSRFRTS